MKSHAACFALFSVKQIILKSMLVCNVCLSVELYTIIWKLSITSINFFDGEIQVWLNRTNLPNSSSTEVIITHKGHSTKKPVTTMLTYPWKCTVLHCNHLGNTWKPLVLMTRHFDYCPSASGRLAWWLLAFLHSGSDYDHQAFKVWVNEQSIVNKVFEISSSKVALKL